MTDRKCFAIAATGILLIGAAAAQAVPLKIVAGAQRGVVLDGPGFTARAREVSYDRAKGTLSPEGAPGGPVKISVTRAGKACTLEAAKITLWPRAGR